MLFTKSPPESPARVRTPPVVVEGNGKGNVAALTPTPNGLASRAMNGSRGSMIQTLFVIVARLLIFNDKRVPCGERLFRACLLYGFGKFARNNQFVCKVCDRPVVEISLIDEAGHVRCSVFPLESAELIENLVCGPLQRPTSWLFAPQDSFCFGALSSHQRYFV